jgi:hypothetical protein
MATGGLFSTPRPEPGHLLPALGGGALILAALPIFLLLGWPVSGWALAAVLWVFVHGLDLILARARKPAANVAGSAVQAFGVFFKAIVLLAVLVATAASHPHVAIAAVVTYALAYTFELGLSLTSYFGGDAK